VLYALDFQSGKTNWVYDAGYPERLTIRAGSAPVVSEGRVIIGIDSGEVMAVAADSGKLLWRYNPAFNDARFHDVVGEMVVRNGRLLMARYDGYVAAIDVAGSERVPVWQDQLPGISSAVMRGSRYYVGAQNGDVYALDTENGGRRVWRAITGATVATMTLVSESTLLVAGTNGRLTALDVATGQILWHDDLGSATVSPPAMFESAIYFTTAMKSVYAYRLK
jgi:outer membrane protein assembly factor BamB